MKATQMKTNMAQYLLALDKVAREIPMSNYIHLLKNNKSAQILGSWQN